MNMISPAISSATTSHEDIPTFVAAMAAAVTPVSIVTTDGPAGRYGVTVSAVSSVSAEPPMVLACINLRSPALDAIKKNGVFCINMLSEEQCDVANSFAGRPGKFNPYDFDVATWEHLSTGAPALCNAAANFDCTLERLDNASTHSILLGIVSSAKHTNNKPLAYTARSYQALDALNIQ